MKKHLVKMLALLLVTGLILAGCGQKKVPGQTANGSVPEKAVVGTKDQTQQTELLGNGDPAAAKEDLSKLLSPAKGKVRILTAVTGGKDANEMKLFAQAMGEQLGLEIEMDKPASDYPKVLAQKLGAGEKYDLVYFNMPTMFNLVDQGVLTDLTARIQKSKVLGNPAVISEHEWSQIDVGGKRYASFNKKEVERLPNINKALAAKAGIDVTKIEPRLDGYYQVFKKMKASQGSDFYALNCVLKDAWDLQPWFSSLGIKTGIVKENGHYKVPMASEQAKPVWEWLKKLYDEKLLDPDCFTNASGDMRNKFQSGKTGVVTDWAAWTGLYNVNAGDKYSKDFEAYPLPGTKSASGQYRLARGDASLWGIPVNAPNPDGAFRILEYFATQHGGDLLSIGIEGNDWTAKAGQVELTKTGLSHGKDHGAPLPCSEQYVSPVPMNPGFREALQYLPYADSEVSNDKTSAYQEIVGRYAIKIIGGQISIGEGIQQMQNELKQQGVIS